MPRLRRLIFTTDKTEGVQLRRRLTVIAALCAAVFSATGCSGADSETAAEPPAEPFDPCSISADAIAATGLNPEIFGNGWSDGIDAGGWLRCTWEGAERSPSYRYKVLFSAEHELTELSQNQQYTNPTEFQSDEHTWLQYGALSAPAGTECGVAFDTVAGLATVEVTLDVLAEGSDPCEMVVRHTKNLIHHFPSQR